MTANFRRPPKEPLDHEPASVTWAREKAGLTKTALAEAIGKSLSLVSEIEAGTRNATPEVIGLMAQALNCPRVVLERKREPATPPPADVDLSRVRSAERAEPDGVPEGVGAPEAASEVDREAS
jgi:transcriptional regulator with XRE-family HTH domain